MVVENRKADATQDFEALSPVKNDNNDLGCYVELLINGVRGVALIDTGATISVIDRTWLLRHNLCRNIRAPKLNKVSALGSVKINVTVFFSGNVQLGSGISCRTNFHVIDCSEVPIILGLDFLKCSGLIVDVAGRRMIKNSGGGSTIVFPMHAEMISKSSPVYSLNAISLAPGERTPEELPLLNTDVSREEIRFVHGELGHAGRDQVYGTCKRSLELKDFSS